MLIVVVLGTTPMKTDLLFDALDDCIKADETVRAEICSQLQHVAQLGQGELHRVQLSRISRVHAGAHRNQKSHNLHSLCALAKLSKARL